MFELSIIVVLLALFALSISVIGMGYMLQRLNADLTLVVYSQKQVVAKLTEVIEVCNELEPEEVE